MEVANKKKNQDRKNKTIKQTMGNSALPAKEQEPENFVTVLVDGQKRQFRLPKQAAEILNVQETSIVLCF